MRQLKSVVLDLKKQIGESRISTNEPMHMHTSFRVGGDADIFIEPETIEELQKTLEILEKNKMEYYIIGNGSNLLVGDFGIRGAVVKIGSKMSLFQEEETIVYAQGGILLSTLAMKAMELGLTGLEFASGIPGTLGGGITMNAGAYGAEMKDILLEVDVLTPTFQVQKCSAQELKLSYRSSIVSDENYSILGAKLQLKKGSKETIKIEMSRLAKERREKQPLQFPSAGSTFKRPEGYFAGKLIQDAGLKGMKIGGAQISEKHSGFVINIGDACAKDIVDLIEFCQKKVLEKFQVHLETEVKFIGEFMEQEI